MCTYYLNFVFLKTGALYEYAYFSTLAHEFTHILGFSVNLLGLYVKPITRTYLGYFNVTTYMFVQRPSNFQAELQVLLQSQFQKSEILPECFCVPKIARSNS